jgi:GTP-binding protein YchF
VKLGLIGLPGSGKTTVFRALTGGVEAVERKGHDDPGLGVVKVDDPRLDVLAAYHKPKKVTPVTVQYLDIAGLTGEGKAGKTIGDKVLSHIRPVDALVHCVRFFDSPSLGPARPASDFCSVQEEMILTDLASVEKRLDRVNKDFRKGKKELAEELDLLGQVHAVLDSAKPLRTSSDLAESERLRGFGFLSAKPELVLINAGEDKTRDDVHRVLEELQSEIGNQPQVALDWLYADTEAELARLSEEEAREFLEEMELEEGAKQRIIKVSFQLLGLIVFFTAGEPEVRAWQLRQGRTAVKAAGAVHSDMERGFIRAEVIAFDDFKAAGSMSAVHKAGKARLEGKEYVVKDGDIILFRFNV